MQSNRNNLALGVLLILLGVWFLVTRFVPGLESWVSIHLGWPLFVIGAGVILLLIGLLTGAVEMAVPACIVGGIGGILYWQNQTGDWASWAYAWALIPGFAGIGSMISGILRGRTASALREGFGAILFSLALFAVFASFLGGRQYFGPYWPLLLILFGVWILLRGLMRSTPR